MNHTDIPFQEFSWDDVVPDDAAAAGAAAEAPAAAASPKRRADELDERSSKKLKSGVFIPRGLCFVPVRDWDLLLYNLELYLRTLS